MCNLIMPKLHIDEVYPKGKIYPMVINFQNGYMSENFKSSACSVLRDKSDNKFTIATDLDDIIYAGKEEQEDLGKTFLLARNKDTGKVRLIEVSTAELTPKIFTKSSDLEELNTSNLELSRKFGSKRDKQREEQRAKLTVNVEMVKQQMETVSKTISEDKLDTSAYTKSDSDDFYVPPINRNADRIEDVYDIDKILTEEQFNTIFTELSDVDYTADIMPWIKAIMSNTKNQKHIVLCVYANALLKLCTTVAKDILRKTYSPCPQSATLNEIILASFMVHTNGKRTRPLQYKDKALCHALVFLLLVNQMKLSVDEFIKGLKVSAATAITKVRVCGATIINTNNKKVAHLKLPLATVNMRRRSAKF